MQQITIINPTKSIHGGFIDRPGQKREAVRFMPGPNLIAKATWDAYLAMAGGNPAPLYAEPAPQQPEEALRFIAASVDEPALQALSASPNPKVAAAAVARIAEITPEKKTPLKKG